MKNFLLRKNKGFTVVETLVAVSIMGVAIAAPLTVAVQAIRAANIAQDQISGFFLAQEGIEYVRYVRDSNILDSTSPSPDWLRYLDRCRAADDTPSDNSPCGIIDPTRVVDGVSDFQDCNPNCVVQYNSGTGLYGNSGSATKFTRNIRVDETIDDQEAEIIVTVSWVTHGKADSVTVRETIFNWSGN